MVQHESNSGALAECLLPGFLGQGLQRGCVWKRAVPAGLSEDKYLMRDCADNFAMQ